MLFVQILLPPPAALFTPPPIPVPPHKVTFVFVCDCVFREFMRTAWEDIERFKEQKDKDLREALISYAIMQISMCKKVRSSVCVLFFSTFCLFLITSTKNMSAFVFLTLKMVLYLSFNVLGNPGVVQRQGVFQQNVSHFPADPTPLHQNSQSDCSERDRQPRRDGRGSPNAAFTLFATLNRSYLEWFWHFFSPCLSHAYMHTHTFIYTKPPSH